MKSIILMLLSFSILSVNAICLAETQSTTTTPSLVGDKKNGKTIYDQSCAYCHKLNGNESLVGAFNLQDISSRRTDDWLNAWLKNPGGFAKVDADAKALIDDEKAILVMPTLPNMQDEQQRLDVIEYLKTLH